LIYIGINLIHDLFDYFCLVATCDLQFKMDRDRYGGCPRFSFLFPFLWSGSKATHGVKKGKVYFEIKVSVTFLILGTSIVLSSEGEDDLSFAYDSRGLKATSGQFETYGKSFREYDLIGCYAVNSVEISFSKNGEDLGQAFHFNKSSLGDHALLPHIICKGCAFQVNFGQKLKPWHKSREGFRFLHDLKSEDLIRTPVPPRSKKACEMLMMVGLPASGKTTWALKHIQENPDKNYIHLSVDRFLPQMEADTLTLFLLATQCLKLSLAVAGSRKANYIIDQVSQWKLLCFTGFTCKAVLLVPPEGEWGRRLEERRKEGEIYPEGVLMQMKGYKDLQHETCKKPQSEALAEYATYWGKNSFLTPDGSRISPWIKQLLPSY
uniref:SPRY domain-containing protein n=1 Tax=Leptobrachium leishanense TaxID=445787 RepID=A0A8C5WF85_9ANUR